MTIIIAESIVAMYSNGNKTDERNRNDENLEAFDMV